MNLDERTGARTIQSQALPIIVIAACFFFVLAQSSLLLGSDLEIVSLSSDSLHPSRICGNPSSLFFGWVQGGLVGLFGLIGTLLCLVLAKRSPER